MNRIIGQNQVLHSVSQEKADRPLKQLPGKVERKRKPLGDGVGLKIDAESAESQKHSSQNQAKTVGCEILERQTAIRQL